MYRTMWRIRAFEQRVLDLFRRAMIRGSTHLYIGEEAVAVGACQALEPKDLITSTHRGHGHCIAKGGDLKPMMSELLGRANGYCKGKGGSMHIADMSLGILGANGIVAGGVCLATGAALASKHLGSEQVVLCFFGDGASNRGTFYEAANMAAIWSLPVVYICENNQYAVSTAIRRITAVEHIATRAQAFGFPGVTVDGNDVLAVYEATLEAVGRARRGDGPTLIEALTYRWEGHMIGDPCVYRSREEVEEWKQRCPIRRFQAYLEKHGVVTAAQAEEIENEEQARADEAVGHALASPEPELSTLWDNVYVGGEKV
ncbi:MAG: thiamine pyrophosphate-dependent dehydrogenase E1 component subunit alpha [Anaerolineae bacterium]